MLKPKIFFTVFVLYEVIAVILLHAPYTCGMMFSGAFCGDSVFKYFLICAAVPMLALVLGMWIHEIFFARRRRSFFHRARNVIDDVALGIKNHLGRTFDARDMDKYLAAAILFGIKKYSSRHPQMRDIIRNIIDGGDIDSYSYTDENDDNDYVAPAPRRATAPKGTRSRSASGTQAAKKRTPGMSRGRSR